MNPDLRNEILEEMGYAIFEDDCIQPHMPLLKTMCPSDYMVDEIQDPELKRLAKEAKEHFRLNQGAVEESLRTKIWNMKSKLKDLELINKNIGTSEDFARKQWSEWARIAEQSHKSLSELQQKHHNLKCLLLGILSQTMDKEIDVSLRLIKEEEQKSVIHVENDGNFISLKLIRKDSMCHDMHE